MAHEASDSWPVAAGQFATTHWSVVLMANCPDGTRAQEALATLCQTYWYPLYAFIRRHGYGPHDAEDLTQAFLAFLLEHKALATADRSRGKFRSFLLASLRHFLANEWDRAQAQKRGGGHPHISLDATTAEMRYGLEPADHTSPDKVFERNWALTLMELVLKRLAAEQEAAGKGVQFGKYQECLMGDPPAHTYTELANTFGLSKDAVKMAVSRLRRRYRELMREEIAHTVSDPAEIDEEIAHLFTVLGT
jgi:DNA-directed RNA polymerase specialized sigma24 family protein